MALASGLSRNRSNAEVLEVVIALIDEARFVDSVVLAEISELHLRRRGYQTVSETAAQVPGELISTTLATAQA